MKFSHPRNNNNPTVGELNHPKIGLYASVGAPRNLNLSTPLATQEWRNGVSCDEFPKLKDGPSLGMKELKDLAVLHRFINRVRVIPQHPRLLTFIWPERRLPTRAKRAKPVTLR